MDVIEGAGDPGAHMHTREMPECDMCEAPFRGRMPNPYWVASASQQRDQDGHPQPAGSIRIYLCRDHRAQLDRALERAARRERNRLLRGQQFLTRLDRTRSLRSLDPSD